ncbi:hypothetical protein KUTeg_024529 [Tegillarca granosa]|uniref:Uncharacterized protein n=1 Tax=Tegillarca granosa TaxID=220873 RepID=A0ABQ9DXL2_TEGGR|nr:hypothetical protein KUTeg_024529 [Tegillarca granosa]
MATDEVDFLKDQVQRLNAELARYRQDRAEQSEQVIKLCWNLKEPLTYAFVLLLSPLIDEYDGQIAELSEQVDLYKEELSRIRPQLDRLIKENASLSDQLREALARQVESSGGGNEEFRPATNDEQVLHNLQEQAESALQEKELALERWQEADNEIDRLQKQLQVCNMQYIYMCNLCEINVYMEKDSHQWKVVEQQANQMQSQYYETVEILNKEIDELQQELRATKQELETALIQGKDMRRTNKELEQQLQWKDQEMADVIFKEGMSDTRMTDLKRIMDDTRNKLSQTSKELDEVKRDKIAVEARLTELQKRCTDLEEREINSVSQVRDAVQMVETAVLEKEQAEVSLKQKEEELDSLQENINKLINEAGARTRQEVDNVRKQCNDRITKLTEELHKMEMDNAEMHEQLQRSVRDKRKVESELENVHKETMNQLTKQKDSYEDLNRRAVMAERARDNYEIKVEAIQSSLKGNELEMEQLKSQTDTEISQLKERMAVMNQEFEHLNDDRLRLLNEVDEMKRRVSLAEKEKENAQRKYQKEVQLSFIFVNRWKEECQTITQKFENKLSDVRSELSHQKKRNDELTNLIKESQEKTLEAERLISDYGRNIRRLEERMRESENRAADAAKQLARQSARERQIKSENRSLIQELQRSTMDSSNRSNIGQADPLLISDLATSKRSMVASITKHSDEIENTSDR